MPLKLYPPRKDKKTHHWTIRGTYLGIYVNRTAGTPRKSVALQQLKALEARIERGEFPEKPEPSSAPTFLDAAKAYVKAGRYQPKRVMVLLGTYFEHYRLDEITQEAIDAAALELLPNASPATRNRKIYTPVSAILHHARVDIKILRPKGAKGNVRTNFLNPEDAKLIISAADARDPIFGLLLRFLLYTGCRISEALALRWEHVDGRVAYVGETKNGDPRTMLLRVHVAAQLEKYRQTSGQTHGSVFPFKMGGGLKDRLVWARMEASGVAIPKRVKAAPAASRRPPLHRLSWVTFHTFRHTFASWARRYGQMDVQGLVATGNWRDERSAARYAHVAHRDEWAKVEKFPSI